MSEVAKYSVPESGITIDEVNVVGSTGLALLQPVSVASAAVRAITICRMCLVRMPISATEKVVLSHFLDMEETDGLRQYSYAELGAVIGKGAYTAEAAVATLRKAGLLLTARVGRSDAKLVFSCKALVGWAEELRRKAGLDGESVVITPVPDTPVSPGYVLQPVASVAPVVEKPRKRSKPAAKKEEPAVPDLAPFATPAKDVQMCAAYDGEFDSAVERADTLRAAGRAGDATDDDEISFGSETADTDIGQGVRINPNI